MADHITTEDLTCNLIRIGAGTGRKVFIHASDAKRWKLHPGDKSQAHVTTDYANAPDGTLLLVKADSGTPGWRIRSKSGDGERDEFYAPTAGEMDRCMSAMTWALNCKEGR